MRPLARALSVAFALAFAPVTPGLAQDMGGGDKPEKKDEKKPVEKKPEEKKDDEIPHEDKEALEKILEKAYAAQEEKKHEDAVKGLDEFFARLEKSKIAPKLKKRIECDPRFQQACCYSVLGKKAEAVKAFARAVECGFDDWKHVDEVKDLDAIRNEADFKKAIEQGKEAAKARLIEEAKEAYAETKKALTKDPLFAYDFEIETLDGKKLKLSDLKGKVVIVDVWGTWCPPCCGEIPSFVKLHDAWKEKGLEIVGIAVENEETAAERQKKVKEFAAKNGIKYTLSAANSQEDPAIAAIPNFEGYPTTLFIDREGKVRARRDQATDHAVLESIAKALLESEKK